MIVWVLILRAVIAGSVMHIFVGTFGTQADCARFAAQLQPKMSDGNRVLCVGSEVKAYSVPSRP